MAESVTPALFQNIIASIMLNEKELRIDIFRSGGQQPILVRIVHIPTGTVAQSVPNRSQISAIREAKEKLEKLLIER
jgi:protein subunit release factor A